MAKKKTILVETTKAGPNWSIKVSARGEDLFQLFGSMVSIFTTENKLGMVNASNPFPPTKTRRKKKGVVFPSPAESVKANTGT